MTCAHQWIKRREKHDVVMHNYRPQILRFLDWPLGFKKFVFARNPAVPLEQLQFCVAYTTPMGSLCLQAVSIFRRAERAKHNSWEVGWYNSDCTFRPCDYSLGKALDRPQKRLCNVREPLVMQFVRNVFHFMYNCIFISSTRNNFCTLQHSSAPGQNCYRFGIGAALKRIIDKTQSLHFSRLCNILELPWFKGHETFHRL